MAPFIAFITTFLFPALVTAARKAGIDATDVKVEWEGRLVSGGIGDGGDIGGLVFYGASDEVNMRAAKFAEQWLRKRAMHQRFRKKLWPTKWTQASIGVPVNRVGTPRFRKVTYMGSSNWMDEDDLRGNIDERTEPRGVPLHITYYTE